MRLLKLLMLVAGLSLPQAFASAEAKEEVTLYKNPQCGCCETYADYLRENGFQVKVVPSHNLSLIRRMANVPDELVGCHTSMINGYVVEGHVPVNIIDRLMEERPAITGISLPGMPAGSPGMTGRKTEPFTIYEIAEERRVYAVE